MYVTKYLKITIFDKLIIFDQLLNLISVLLSENRSYTLKPSQAKIKSIVCN